MKITDMTLEEKILQTAVVRIKREEFAPLQAGAAFFFGEIITDADDMGIAGARELLQQYQEQAKIPLLITSDFENGCGGMLKGFTEMPYLMGLGATGSEELAYDYGKATALEARSIGANWSFSPVSDLNLNFRNPLVNVRGMTDNPELAARLLRQVVRGMQDHGLAACAKHFPGDGVDWRDQHIVTTHNSLSWEEWKKLSGYVFEQLIEEDVYSVMPGHITLPAYQKQTVRDGLHLPATLSEELISNLLKKEMGFQGVVVTDATDMGGYLGWYQTKVRSEIESMRAGCDMILWPTKNYVANMKEAVENHYISMERLDDAVSRVLDMKEKLGLFRESVQPIRLSDAEKCFVKDTAQNVAEKSLTLMRNQLNVLPIDTEKIHKVAYVPVANYDKVLDNQAVLLKNLLEERGLEVEYFPQGISTEENESVCERNDLVLYALFSRSFRPIGFLDYYGNHAYRIAKSLCYGAEKSVVVSFGSPYFFQQYFERSYTYVNAYAMVDSSVEAFVKAMFGETEFTGVSPVDTNLQINRKGTGYEAKKE